MRNRLLWICVCCLAAGLVGAVAGTQIEIVVSPKTLVLGSTGPWVTVHTDIALSAVDSSTLTLNDIHVTLAKSDARGNLVAKFRQSAVEAMVAPPEATLVLKGARKDGTLFSGSDTIRVIEGGPR